MLGGVRGDVERGARSSCRPARILPLLASAGGNRSRRALACEEPARDTRKHLHTPTRDHMSHLLCRARGGPVATFALGSMILVAPGFARAQGVPSAGQATSSPVATSIATRTAGWEKRDGFVPIYLDQRQGKILLEIPRDSMRALLLISQATGLGSNPIGIDRGSSEPARVVRFDRDGERVLVIFENWGFRSSDSANAAHQRTVQEAFPPSTVAALPLVAQEGGRLVVDATD